MNVLDLFSGIGGFSLGLERAGMRTVAFCEIDPYCRRVLAKHWPAVPIYGDIRTLTGAQVMADAAVVLRRPNASGMGEGESGEGVKASGGRIREGDGRARHDGFAAGGIDVICGGFPCQDISTAAGKGVGIDGSRSGLWSEYARIIGEVRPRYVIVENVAALLGRGLDRVLGDLAALGFDAEWHCIPASAVGAPHRRDRVWIVAHAECERRGGVGATPRNGRKPDGCSEDVANARSAGFQEWHRLLTRREIADATASSSVGWEFEPDVGRVAHGVPARVHRLRALGNAVVPQIPELIGRAIMKANR